MLCFTKILVINVIKEIRIIELVHILLTNLFKDILIKNALHRINFKMYPKTK